ncbi:hypothetical protein Zm00014a_032846 [Zea mays]|uniref:DnaJ/Hsp40 cysteine-rich domain superfamily protein n=3 Tax=Zea mays TaxID=4577 RepID=A0A1D6GL71_MAIZE|nr:DnaJ/Hsp40 cysteine-rich domain superfamily protein [Zea mays]PWZ20845.1 hypothetical protein Zm00014a_032846 [Zea mays]|eukprot:XP_008681642.1 uncharacterized protein LOC100276646 isoform X1 [Zea mays]
MDPKLLRHGNLRSIVLPPVPRLARASAAATASPRKIFLYERMEVSAGLRLPPVAAAASLLGCRSASVPPRAAASHSVRSVSRAVKIRAAAINGLQRNRSNLESLFCYDKSVPEQDIGEPSGLNLEKKNVGDKPPCSSCEAKGALLCATCAGSGLYVDSILESQGIIVKVRCLGCGGTGNIMCSKCGGRGHT